MLGRLLPGLPLLSSDAIRAERNGHGSPDYSAAGRAAIYAELGRRAGLERAVIVDASFGDEVASWLDSLLAAARSA